MKIVAVIPARYKSSRFPGKPLADINGKPMIYWVYKHCIDSSVFDEVMVATDDNRIMDACCQYGMNSMLTSDNNQTGTDRVAEVASRISADIFVNVQGDEPLLEPDVIAKVIQPIRDNPEYDVVNLMTQISDPVDFINFTIPKVITNNQNRGIYLTRSPTPYPKGSINYPVYKQVCVCIPSECTQILQGIWVYKREEQK